MDCKETRDLLPAHADRELGLRDAAEIDRHLLVCPACQGESGRQNALRAVVKKHATRFAPPAQLEARIQAALTPESQRTTPSNQTAPSKRTWRWNWLNLGAVLASAFAVVWSLLLYLAVPTAEDLLADEVVSSHVRSLMVNHIADVASSDQHTVKPWFNGKLDFSPTVADFTAQGFPSDRGQVGLPRWPAGSSGGLPPSATPDQRVRLAGRRRQSERNGCANVDAARLQRRALDQERHGLLGGFRSQPA